MREWKIDQTREYSAREIEKIRKKLKEIDRRAEAKVEFDIYRGE
jgi:hypothetical protein